MSRLSRFARKKVRQLLRNHEYALTHVPGGSVSGIDLPADLRTLIDEDSPLCLDVGANRGQTVEMLRATFASPRIHAFEPSSESFSILRRRDFGDEVHVHHCAVGELDGEFEFINYDDSCLNSFLPLKVDENSRFRDVRERSREFVRSITVDRFVEDQGLGAIDLLKIDTQGFDLQVLRGARRSLRSGRIGHVLVELNLVPLYEGQSDPREIEDLLAGNGLRLVDYYEKAREENLLAWCTALFARR